MRRSARPSPALFISLLALFFALGGTAFAVGSHALVAQPRCATGAVRGIAVVNGESVEGVGNMSDKYSTDGGLFGYRWSCTGKPIQVKRTGGGSQGFDIQFIGNPSTVAIVSSDDGQHGYGSSVSRNSDGSFHVQVGGTNGGSPGTYQDQLNISFTIVLL
jgi:hypothetical protein